jgi:hypothetical protein
LLFLSIVVAPTIATPNNEITVCSSGCDYTAIQPAINASTPGDTIVVAMGVYTGQLILKSGITLTAQSGPTATNITALASPIISGSNVSTASLQGFSILSAPAFTSSIGIDLLDSSVIISNVVISNLQGADGDINYPDGLPAIGLQISGTFNITFANSIIDNIVGGNADVDSSGRGGDAIGIVALGDGRLVVVSSTVRNITGGAPGMALSCVVCCDGVGGHSLGITKEGPATLVIEQSTITSLTGGPPCRPSESPYQCPHNAGDATAIRTISGALDVHNSLLANNEVYASYENTKSVGIAASNGTRLNVENTEISALFAISTGTTHSAITAPQSPYCVPGHGSAVGLWLDSDDNATIARNVIQNLQGVGLSGQASGLYARDSQHITVTNNQINNLTGGSYWYPQDLLEQATYGIVIDAGAQAALDSNRISHLYGGQGAVFGYGEKSGGGETVGLQVVSTTESSVTNNVFDSLVGGDGANFPSTWTGEIHNAGNATGIRIDGGTCTIQNNTVYFMQGGDRGYPSDIDGQGISIRLDGILDAFVTNNAFVSSTVGVSSTTNAYLWDYNALWENTRDYSGIVTGPHDVHLEPAFVDPAKGDFHLRLGSPLVDAGFNVGAPDRDFDGNPRPFDVNYDGQAQTDIGAYEYQANPPAKVYLPVIFTTSH